jgi:hypothetical protein
MGDNRGGADDVGAGCYGGVDERCGVQKSNLKGSLLGHCEDSDSRTMIREPELRGVG